MRRLSGAIARPVAHIESRSESLCVCYVGSLEGREGRTPRRRSPRRLYRVVSAGTDTPSGAPGREPCRAEGALTSGCIVLHYSPRFVKCPRGYAVRRLFGAIARPVAHIESRSESLCGCYVGSLKGREGTHLPDLGAVFKKVRALATQNSKATQNNNTSKNLKSRVIMNCNTHQNKRKTNSLKGFNNVYIGLYHTLGFNTDTSFHTPQIDLRSGSAARKTNLDRTETKRSHV